MLAGKVQTGDGGGPPSCAAAGEIAARLRGHMARTDAPLHLDCVLLATSLKDSEGIDSARKILDSADHPEATRHRALEALVVSGDGRS